MNSKIIVIIFAIFFSLTSFARTAGIYLNGNLVDSEEAGQQLLKAYATLGSDADACYESSYEEAFRVVNTSTDDAVWVTIYDVYGEGAYPTLDIEIHNTAGAYASGLLSACH